MVACLVGNGAIRAYERRMRCDWDGGAVDGGLGVREPRSGCGSRCVLGVDEEIGVVGGRDDCGTGS